MREFPYGDPKTEEGARAIIQLMKEKFANKEYGYVEGLYTNWLSRSVRHKPLPLELRKECKAMYYTHFLVCENIGLEAELARYPRDPGGWYKGTISDNKEKMDEFASRSEQGADQ